MGDLKNLSIIYQKQISIITEPPNQPVFRPTDHSPDILSKLFDQEMYRRISSITGKILATPIAKDHCPKRKPTITLLNSSVSNAGAFRFLGALVFFNGLWKGPDAFIDSDNNNQLAFVVGHEIAHLCDFTPSKELQTTLSEKNADIYGMLMASQAGFNPIAAPLLFARKAGDITRFTSRKDPHPSNQTRADYLTTRLSEAQAYYQRTKTKSRVIN